MTTSQYEAFFDELDADDNGSASLEEMKQLMRRKGHTDGQIQTFFDTADTSADGKITKTEFMTAMGCATPEQMKEAALRRAFYGFDADRNGTISKAELEKTLEENGKDFSQEEIDKMMAMCDTGDDGLINYEEFITKFFNQ